MSIIKNKIYKNRQTISQDFNQNNIEKSLTLETYSSHSSTISQNPILKKYDLIHSTYISYFDKLQKIASNTISITIKIAMI